MICQIHRYAFVLAKWSDQSGGTGLYRCSFFIKKYIIQLYRLAFIPAILWVISKLGFEMESWEADLSQCNFPALTTDQGASLRVRRLDVPFASCRNCGEPYKTGFSPS